MEKFKDFLAEVFSFKSGFYATIGVIGGAIATALGGWDVLLETLIWFMVLDYITGLVVAGIFHNSGKSETGALESRASLKGLFRKGGILVVVIVAVHLDEIIGSQFVRSAVLIAFIVSEGISIMENVGLMGVTYPDAIRKAFDILSKKAEEGTESA